jgi:shikimate kinase
LSAKNIWFIFGLSGAGKSFLGDHLANDNNWLHLQLDTSEQNTAGVTIENIYELFNAWNMFKNNHIPDQLIEKITWHYKHNNKSGAVVSFPSVVMTIPKELELLKGSVKIVYLYGEKPNCLGAFLQREAVEHRLPQDTDSVAYWEECNKSMLYALTLPSFAPYIINAFHKNGERKTAKKIINEAMKADRFPSKLIRLCSRLLSRR